MSDVTTKMAHYTEGMSQKSFNMKIRKPLNSGRVLRAIAFLSTGEPHFVKAVYHFPYVSIIHVFHSLLSWWSKIVI